MSWELRWRDGRRLAWDRPLVMGVVNVTPDSFSDGGRFADTDAAIEHATGLIADGADIVDVGGESTRPGATPVEPAVERDRVVPVIAALADRHEGLISVDTRHARVAVAAIEAGAGLINDVSGLDDPAMTEVCAGAGVPVVVMHHRGIPAAAGAAPAYDDVVAEVSDHLAARASAALAAGVSSVIVDPGLGFGKSVADNLALLRAVPYGLDHPVLVGASRKRFVGELTGVAGPAERDDGSVAVHLYAAARGAAIVRVHDVAAHVTALRAWQALDDTDVEPASSAE